MVNKVLLLNSILEEVYNRGAVGVVTDLSRYSVRILEALEIKNVRKSVEHLQLGPDKC
jgi:hypothetical protein